MTLPRRMFPLSLGLLGLMAVLGAVLSGSSRRLPDGSTVVLEGVTYGREHSLYCGPAGFRPLLPLLPASWRSAWSDAHRSQSGDTLVVWTHRQWRPAVPHPAPVYAVLVDEAGREWETGKEIRPVRFMDLYSNPVDEERDAWEFTVIPRITRTLRVRVYPLERHPPSQGWSTRAASAVEFSVANPAAGPVPRPAMAAYPDNEFQPLPLTQRASGLKITLLGLSPTPDAPDDLRPACLVSTAVRFRVVEDGKPTTLWRPYAITIKDRSGTVWEPEVSYSSDATAPGEVWARLRGRVCTDGGPYKLEAWFMQGGTGNYAEFFVKQ